MIGRAAYHDPYLLAEADRRLFGDDHPVPSRQEIVQEMLPYLSEELGRGTRLHTMTRHMLGLFHGMPGGRAWRRQLGERAVKPGAGLEVLADTPAPSLSWRC